MSYSFTQGADDTLSVFKSDRALINFNDFNKTMISDEAKATRPHTPQFIAYTIIMRI